MNKEQRSEIAARTEVIEKYLHRVRAIQLELDGSHRPVIQKKNSDLLRKKIARR
jgi:hypothetical protein